MCTWFPDESEGDCQTKVDLLYSSIIRQGCLKETSMITCLAVILYFWCLDFAFLGIFESSGAHILTTQIMKLL